MDYKNTLNLPQTDFPMKANLNTREPQILAEWEKAAFYGKARQASKGKPLFILHDGPPYANGHIHIGHALNKILKDIIVRYKTLRGFDAPYTPGWDCHGLPVEHQLFKDLKKTKEQIDRVEFRKLAHDFAMKFVEIQRDEFKRLGITGDWAHPYLTLDKGYEHAILVSFAQLVQKGYVYRGLKPVNWCYKCETALAEAEVEYEDHESDSVFVKFELVADAKAKSLGLAGSGDSFILIWTTTPWTLLANVAVAVHPDLDYVFVQTNNGSMIVGKDLFGASLKDQAGLKEHKVSGEFKGRDLEGLTYKHPFGSREGKVVLADYVSKEEGTGCVHTAPGHGQEDFLTGLKYKLDVLMPVDEKGRFDQSAKEFSGLHVFAANEKIIEKLKDLNRLQARLKIVHTYPHCWRCKNPIIFRATQQWFLRIDHNNLRDKVLTSIKKDIRWIPSSGQERISSMVENRPDWCLSRQRYWGVPIPAVICKQCHEHILHPDVIKKLAQEVLKEGTNAWFTQDVKDFLPKDFKCACGSRDFERSTDILDVWFDSGVSHQAVLKDKPGLKLPADLYLEGSDQHRGWFQASLIPSMAIDGKAPFVSVLTHGFVVDGEGRKMSKSQGNVIAPQEIIKDFGADILRLWVLSSDYNEDVRISKEILAFVADAYRKIRNTVRFLLGNLYDFNPNTDSVPVKDMLLIDRWAIFELIKVSIDVTAAYNEYSFYQAFQRLYGFCNETMSSLYLDILKDRLYTSGKTSLARRSAQTALYEILMALTRMLAPVLPFTAEEIYHLSPKEKAESFESVQLLSWSRLFKEDANLSPLLDKYPKEVKERYRVEHEDLKDIYELFAIRPDVLKALEGMRAKGEIGSALEAKLLLTFKDKERFDIFRAHLKKLPFIFIVSQVDVVWKETIAQPYEVKINAADGKKCARCWNYSVDVDSAKEYPGICGRCVEAIASNEDTKQGIT